MKKPSKIILAGFCLLAFIAIWYLANTELGRQLDFAITNFVYNYGQNDFLLAFFIFITNYTFGELIGILIMLMYGAWKKDKLFLSVSTLSCLIILVLDWYLKNQAGRLRPFMVLNNVHNISDYLISDYSFPSGHTVFAFFIAYILINHFKLKNWLAFLLYAVAFLVGFSRIYLGVHYFLDVAGGMCLGILFGIITEKVLDYLGKERMRVIIK